MVPPFPSSVRFANPPDLPRLGLILAASYVNSPQFPYMRPHFAEYPADTVADFSARCGDGMMNPQHVCIVLEDEVNLTEKEDVCKELRELWPDYGEEDRGKKVVVAVACIAVPKGNKWASEREGDGLEKDIPSIESPHRDTDEEGMKLVGAAVGPFFKKNTVTRGTINMFVVHPSYRNHRHGDTLMSWVKQFFMELKIGYYLAATPEGKKLYLRHGAKEVEKVVVPGYKLHPESFVIWMCQWDLPEPDE